MEVKQRFIKIIGNVNCIIHVCECLFFGLQGKEEAGGEGADCVLDGRLPVPDPLSGQPREPSRKVSRKKHRALVNKPQDFQVVWVKAPL